LLPEELERSGPEPMVADVGELSPAVSRDDVSLVIEVTVVILFALLEKYKNNVLCVHIKRLLLSFFNSFFPILQPML